jgi:hypothetical protein
VWIVVVLVQVDIDAEMLVETSKKSVIRLRPECWTLEAYYKGMFHEAPIAESETVHRWIIPWAPAKGFIYPNKEFSANKTDKQGSLVSVGSTPRCSEVARDFRASCLS